MSAFRPICRLIAGVSIWCTCSPSQAQQAPVPTPPAAVPGSLLHQGKWMYTWPWGEIPNPVPGYTTVSSPDAATMANWGKSTVVKSEKTSATVTLWCNRDYSGVTIDQPWLENWGDWCNVKFDTVEFHQLPAIAGKLSSSDTPVSHKAFFAFLMNKVLFRIEAHDRTPDGARRSAREAAEAVYQFQKRKNIASPTVPAPVKGVGTSEPMPLKASQAQKGIR